MSGSLMGAADEFVTGHFAITALMIAITGEDALNTMIFLSRYGRMIKSL